MEQFQVERSTRRQTTAFLPSRGGIPTRQHPGSRQPPARAVRPHRPRGSQAGFRVRSRTETRAPRPRAAAGAREAGGEQGCRLLLRARLRRAGGRASQLLLFSKRPGGAPGVEVGRGRPPASPLDGQHEGARGWFSRSQGQKSDGGSRVASTWPCRQNDLAPKSCLCPSVNLCDLGQVDTFLNCARFSCGAGYVAGLF